MENMRHPRCTHLYDTKSSHASLPALTFLFFSSPNSPSFSQSLCPHPGIGELSSERSCHPRTLLTYTLMTDKSLNYLQPMGLEWFVLTSDTVPAGRQVRWRHTTHTHPTLTHIAPSHTQAILTLHGTVLHAQNLCFDLHGSMATDKIKNRVCCVSFS